VYVKILELRHTSIHAFVGSTTPRALAAPPRCGLPTVISRLVRIYNLASPPRRCAALITVAGGRPDVPQALLKPLPERQR
jgi:hypothetical protein